MKKISLNGTWQITGRPQNATDADKIVINGNVPGCIQLDLSESGYLPRDLYMGKNILENEKFEGYEWEYERKFYIEKPEKNTFLVFEGVDCLAEYFLNGSKLGESENMFITHEFKADDLIKAGENTLCVRISSATLAALEEEYDIKIMSSNINLESRFIRKAPHSYGWDIMPRAVTAGLWREVRLEVRDNICFSQKFIYTRGDECMFFYTLETEITDFPSVEIKISGSCGEDSRFQKNFRCKRKFGHFTFKPDNPKKWFPYGYGDANVYDCIIEIYYRGELVHSEPFHFGIRDVALDRADAKNGKDGKFRILINGVEVMCKGTNWVPMDAFHSRDAQRYEKALCLAKDIGCNIIRCWGGNVYEDHEFFDFCDRNGIMVWQDFAMACYCYPETEGFKQKLQKEVTAVIRKLRNHPSIILWAGDNEVDAGTRLFNPNDNSLTREVIPKCVELNDIGRPYLPSSPYISPEAYASGFRSQAYGSALPEDHLWGPRDYYKSEFYKSNRACFVSETGYHGCPSLESIKKFITPEKVWPYAGNDEWILHSTDQNGNDKRVMLMEKQVRVLFGKVPTEPEEYILASQISQAEAKKYFIERMRVDRPHKTGIIWWNLLDGWPQMSDAVVDYYYTKKLAYHYIKISQAPFTIAADEPKNGSLNLYACNDTLASENGILTVKEAFSGEIIHSCAFTAKENASTLIATLKTAELKEKMLIFEWSTVKESGRNHYLCNDPPIDLAEYKKFLKLYFDFYMK
jgi:beta-mannosidase